MRKIDISITKAKILSYRVELNDSDPEVSAEIGLFTGSGKQLTTFAISSKSFYEPENKFEIPVEMIKPMLEIAKKLETILVRKCNSAIGYLSEDKDSIPF